MTAERCRSTADPAEPLSDAELLIGLVVSPSLSAMLGPEVTTSVRKMSNCQDLWIGVSCDVLLAS